MLIFAILRSLFTGVPFRRDAFVGLWNRPEEKKEGIPEQHTHNNDTYLYVATVSAHIK